MSTFGPRKDPEELERKLRIAEERIAELEAALKDARRGPIFESTRWKPWIQPGQKPAGAAEGYDALLKVEKMLGVRLTVRSDAAQRVINETMARAMALTFSSVRSAFGPPDGPCDCPFCEPTRRVTMTERPALRLVAPGQDDNENMN